MKKQVALTLLILLITVGVSFAEDGLTPGKPLAPDTIWRELVALWQHIAVML